MLTERLEYKDHHKRQQIKHTSLLPLPKPFITLPPSLIGKGGSGPASGPAIGSLGPFGFITVC